MNDKVFMLPTGEVVSFEVFLEHVQPLLLQHGFYVADDIEDLPDLGFYEHDYEDDDA